MIELPAITEDLDENSCTFREAMTTLFPESVLLIFCKAPVAGQVMVATNADRTPGRRRAPATDILDAGSRFSTAVMRGSALLRP